MDTSIIVRLTPDDLKTIIDKYLRTADDITIKDVYFNIQPNTNMEKSEFIAYQNPYILKDVVCVCEKFSFGGTSA